MTSFCLYSSLVLTLGADSSETQLAWLQAFSEKGLEILPSADEADEMVKGARSIFDFEAKDIDGNVVSLDRYRWVYHVTYHSHCVWYHVIFMCPSHDYSTEIM